MLYTSTRNNTETVSSAQAIAQGISSEGGLFVPESFPQYDMVTFEELLKLDYNGRAKKVISDYLTDFTEDEISLCVDSAYTKEKFGSENPAP
ncbi:MAG: threonine synthase, partial [Ruminococcus sp.]